MKRQGQAINSSGLGRIAPLPDSNPTRGRPLCNRKKMMGRNVNPGLTEPKKISETSGVKAALDEAAERIEATWREKLLRETADLRTENALLMAQVGEFSRKLAEATDRNEKIEADCNERVAFIEEKFELDTASLELENNELHAASVRYLADARELDRQVVQLHAEAVAMVDEIERLRGERDAALKAQAELNDALLAQRDLMAEVAALKDRLAASEQRAAVAEAKIEVMTQMKIE